MPPLGLAKCGGLHFAALKDQNTIGLVAIATTLDRPLRRRQHVSLASDRDSSSDHSDDRVVDIELRGSNPS
jgi:hypothetical protein